VEPTVIAQWHRAVAEHDLAEIDALFADDATFVSPAVHTPQIGKTLVTRYIHAALAVLNTPSFRYVDAWYGEDSAVLEFEVTIDDLYVNGIDIIRWNASGKIVFFKVMARPLKALNLVVAKMGVELRRVGA
jgi:hypothetical protein